MRGEARSMTAAASASVMSAGSGERRRRQGPPPAPRSCPGLPTRPPFTDGEAGYLGPELQDGARALAARYEGGVSRVRPSRS